LLEFEVDACTFEANVKAVGPEAEAEAMPRPGLEDYITAM